MSASKSTNAAATRIVPYKTPDAGGSVGSPQGLGAAERKETNSERHRGHLHAELAAGSLAGTLVEARRNGRVCPRQEEWRRFRAMIYGIQAAESPSECALADEHPALDQLLLKRQQVGVQISNAARCGMLGEAYTFLRTLQESQWIHFDDAL